MNVLKNRLPAEHYSKLVALNNPKLSDFVADAVELCNPDSVYVCSDASEDIEYIRNKAITLKEETPLKMEGHTYHFDGYKDQARDKKNTRYLVPVGVDMGNLNSIEREKGLSEVRGFLKDAMKGKEMFVRIFCLGPVNSPFSISAVQLTDSAYVAHSEDILYRSGYEQFRKLEGSGDFFRVLHCAGELDENACSVNVDKRRIYIDFTKDLVYSVNNQYAGNSVGFKKLCLRLSIRKAMREGWLSEHMFVMGVHGTGDRVTYFTGAFPSACGKTSTAMVQGETIIGDDIAYLRRINGEVRTVNVESGVFGIIRDVNAVDDPMIMQALTTPGEIIFSNILVSDGVPYWLGDQREHPESGINFAGNWKKGMKDENGIEIPPSHKNARFTLRLSSLPNLDSLAEDSRGVPVGGIIYGGRDSDTCIPVQQSFNWGHGVITMGASLESETTAATLGQEGVRAFQPMSILDFLSLKVGNYIDNYLNFASGMTKPPLIFGVNYFLKDENGGYLNGKKDKYVWLKWMERRVYNEVSVIETPTGLIPEYKDLKELFKAVLNKDYSIEEYEQQFSIRIPHIVAKINRITDIYRKDASTPKVFFDVMEEQRSRLLETQAKFGDIVKPSRFISG